MPISDFTPSITGGGERCSIGQSVVSAARRFHDADGRVSSRNKSATILHRAGRRAAPCGIGMHGGAIAAISCGRHAERRNDEPFARRRDRARRHLVGRRMGLKILWAYLQKPKQISHDGCIIPVSASHARLHRPRLRHARDVTLPGAAASISGGMISSPPLWPAKCFNCDTRLIVEHDSSDGEICVGASRELRRRPVSCCGRGAAISRRVAILLAEASRSMPICRVPTAIAAAPPLDKDCG